MNSNAEAKELANKLEADLGLFCIAYHDEE
jgi:hypothetical protein